MLELLKEAKVFTKLDLSSAYNLSRIRAGDECEFHKSKDTFLGYIIDTEEVSMDEKKIIKHTQLLKD